MESSQSLMVRTRKRRNNSEVKDFYLKLLLTIFFFFLAALCLRCYTRAVSSCGELGLLFTVVRGLLIAVASLVVEHGN